MGGAPETGALESVFGSLEMQHALHEAAWAARVLLHADASVVFLARPALNQMAAIAWHGREAGDCIIKADSACVKALRGGRRSIMWDRRDHCPDPELVPILDSMNLLSGLVVPVLVNGEFTGMWLGGSAAERFFSESHELILQTLAENIGLTTRSLLLAAENLRYRREADALYDIGKEISQLMDLDRALELIAKKTCSLLNAEISYIALADEEAQMVRVRITEGTRNDFLRTMVLKYGEGVGGYVASTRKPLLVDNYPLDSRPKPPGIAYIAATEDIVSIISVPMFTRRGLIGVLFAASRKEAAFNHSQLDLLYALGTQAAIAIENARLYEQAHVTADKLRISMDTHARLLNLVLSNQGLQPIADTLSTLVHCPIIVVDNRFHTLVSSEQGCAKTELDQTTPAELSLLAADVWQGSELRGTIRLPAHRERRIHHSRVIAPIAAGNALLGYVAALELGQTMNEQQRTAIEQASIVFALEFLKQEAAQSVEQRMAGDLLDDLLACHHAGDTNLLQRAARHNVDLRRVHRIMVLDIDQFGRAIEQHRWSEIEALNVKRRFLGTVNDIVQSSTHGGLVGTRDDSVLVLVPEPTARNVADSLGLARSVQAALNAALPDVTISIGLGGLALAVDQLSRSLNDALLALRMSFCVEKRNCVIAFEELGVIPLLLQTQDQQALIGFMERHLRALIDYDEQYKTRLVSTLQLYLANNGNMHRTAQECHIHLNSLKYRLRRIRDISHLEMGDGGTRFNLQLALSIRSALDVLEERQLIAP